MKNKLLIIGASGHGKVVADIALKMNKWENIAFLDDNKSLKSSLDLEIIGTSNELNNFINDWDIFVGIGDNAIRQKIHQMLEILDASIPIIIHPSSVIGTQVMIGKGTVIMPGAIINCCTKIGKGCIINTGSTIDHDNTIHDFVHISPGAHLAGTVSVGESSWIGIGSVIINNVTIHQDSKIGAGAVVIKDITDSGLFVGVPAKRLK